MLAAGVLFGMRFEDWVVIVIVAAGLVYLAAFFAGEFMMWWEKSRADRIQKDRR